MFEFDNTGMFIQHLATAEPDMWDRQYRVCAPSILIEEPSGGWNGPRRLCPACHTIGKTLYERDKDGTNRGRVDSLGG